MKVQLLGQARSVHVNAILKMTEQEPGQPLEGISQALADSWAIEGVWQGVGRV